METEVGAQPDVDAFIAAQPVGRLATADADGVPHVVPVCYAYEGGKMFGS